MKSKLFLVTLITTFFIQFSQAQFNPRANWKDSYNANGFCWCDSNFDHGLDGKTVLINGKNYNVKNICNELKKHPLYRAFKNGDTPYNDIQCGNGPINNATDEAGCPGRVDIGSSGCNQIGPRWDMNWLQSRPIFNGNGNIPNNDNVKSIKASNGKYVSSEDGKKPISANRNGVGSWEKFTLVSQGGTIYAVRGNNGKYISSENGKKEMTINRNGVGSWEKFTLISQGGNIYALRGNNNKYVTLTNTGKLACNKASIGNNEKFNMSGINNTSKQINSTLKPQTNAENFGISIYPNPAKFLDANIKISLENDMNTTISIIDITGKLIISKELGIVKKGVKTITISQIDHIENLNTGFYILKIRLNDNITTKRLIIK